MKNMIRFFISLLLGFTTLHAVFMQPVGHSVNSFFDALEKNCAAKLDDRFKNQHVFKKCQNWPEIDKTKEITETNVLNVLCLLYYDSFILFCNELPKSKVNVTSNQLLLDLKDYHVDICKNLTLFPTGKKFVHNINKIINTEVICYKLCVNFDGTLVPECALSHYYANYNVSQSLPNRQSNVKPPDTKSQSNINTESVSKPDTAVKAKTGGKPEFDVNKITKFTNKVEPPSVDVVKLVSTQNEAGQPQKNAMKTAQDTEEIPSTGQQISTLQNEPNITLKGNSDSDTTMEKTYVSKSNIDDTEDTQVKIDSTMVEETSKGPNAIKNEPLKPDDTRKSNVYDSTGEQLKDDGTGMDPTGNELNSLNTRKQMEGNEGNEQTVVDNDNYKLEGKKPDVNNDKLEGKKPDVNNDKLEGKKPDVNNVATTGEKKGKTSTSTLSEELPVNYNSTEDLSGESYFFSYFMVICVLFVLGYVGYHNRQKVLALVLEGKRGKRQVRSRRPNSANYHKLDSNLEEAISSNCTKNSSHVIY